MEYFKRSFHIITRNIFNNKINENDHYVEYSKMDAYLNYIHKVLVWEDPTITWVTLGALNFLFWLIVYLELRLYGAFFLVILVLFVTDLYFEQCGLKAQRTPSSDSVRQVVNFFVDVIVYMKALRKDNASMFCGIMCVLFLTLSFIARSINGYLLSYVLLLNFFFAPLLFSKLPTAYVQQIKSCLQTISTNEDIVPEKELMPVLPEKDDDADSLVSEKTADSVTNSLISGISAMPSYLDAEGSIDGLDEEDLELPQAQSQSKVFNKAAPEYSSDSDSDHRNMEFDSSHFNRDTSSSDDENGYSKGLSFVDTVDLASNNNKPSSELILTQSIGAGIISNLSSVGTTLITNVLSSVTRKQTRQDSDSDFEIINSDDLNEET